MAGASCARALADAGVPVRVLDRGRAPGGRLASPELHGRRVDLGAAYFTVEDPEFDRLVADWQRRGLAREWTDRFDSSPPRTAHSGSVRTRWAAPGGSRTLVRDLLDGIELELKTEVSKLRDADRGIDVAGVHARSVVLAMPDPQAARLIPADGRFAELRSRLTVGYSPVVAVTLGFDERAWDFSDGVFVNDDPDVTFVADDGARRGDEAPVLVVHTTAELAGRHLEDPDGVVDPVLASLRHRLGIDAAPRWTATHRWGMAKPTSAHDELFAVLDAGAAGRVAVAGDAWCPSGSPRVESAWLSGRRLAQAWIAELV